VHVRRNHSARELDAAIAEMNAEMAELFGTATGGGDPGPPPAVPVMAPMHSTPVRVPRSSGMPQPEPSQGGADIEAIAALQAKIKWAAGELTACDDAPRVTALAECISACAHAMTDLGEHRRRRVPA